MGLLGTLSNKFLPALPQMNLVHCSSYIFFPFVFLPFLSIKKEKVLWFIQSCADCITYQQQGGLTGTSCDFSSTLHTSNLHQHSCVSLHFRHTSETAHLSRNHPHHNHKPGMPFFLPLAALWWGRENEAAVTLNRQGHASTWPLEESSLGHPKAQSPFSFGAGEINPTWIHTAVLMTFHWTTCKYSRDSAHPGGPLLPGQLRAICRTVVLFFVPHLFKPSWLCLPSPSHALAGMLNADETILDTSSSTYFRAINLAS